MNLQDIEAFIALAETGSVNRAALRLHLTQPAATRRVQNFEAALGGAALLDRSAKPPVLTPAGRQVLEHCRGVIRAIAEIEASVKTGAPVGELRIGIAHGLGQVVLGTPLDGLRRGLPGVRLQVSSNWTARLIEEVRNGALDCAIGLITSEHVLPGEIVASAVGPESVVVVAAKEAKMRRASRAPLRLRDLADEGWILNPPGCGCRAALQRAFDRANAPMQVSAEIFGEELQLSMIARGAGLGLVPRRQFEHSPHRARLRIVKLGDFALEATIAMLHGRELGNLAAPVDRLKTHIAAGLKKL